MKRKWWIPCVAVLAAAGAAMFGSRARAQAAPATGTGSVTFSSGNQSNQAISGGLVRITAKKPNLPDLDVTVPVAVNMDMSAIAAFAAAQAPASWTGAPPSILASGNSLLFTGISQLDGDAGKTKINITWTVTNDIPVTSPDGKKKLSGTKTGDGGRSGQFLIVAGGWGPNGVGECEVRTATMVTWFDAADSIAVIMARVADRLTREGWSVEYSPATPQQIVINRLPTGEAVTTCSLSIDYDESVAESEYHWVIQVGEQD